MSTWFLPFPQSWVNLVLAAKSLTALASVLNKAEGYIARSDDDDFRTIEQAGIDLAGLPTFAADCPVEDADFGPVYSWDSENVLVKNWNDSKPGWAAITIAEWEEDFAA